MSLKLTYYCPFDETTKIIRVPRETDNLYLQLHDSNDKLINPSKIFKFAKCKTSEPSVHRSIHQYNDFNCFYKAKDIWEFDNIGVSKPPSNIKNAEFIKVKSIENGEVRNYAIVRYLVCGHCDKGAFGFGGYLLDSEQRENHVEIGFDLSTVNPNDLTYFFYY